MSKECLVSANSRQRHCFLGIFPGSLEFNQRGHVAFLRDFWYKNHVDLSAHIFSPSDNPAAHRHRETFTKRIQILRTMNQVATILGIQLPALKARDAIRAESISTSSVSIIPHRDSLLLLNDHFLQKDGKSLESDDETVSTMLSSCSSLGLGVTFADPVVTEVHTRPYTTRQERNRLFYNDQDYLEFKRDYFYGTSRETIVKFKETVVSHVWTVPKHEEPSDMYYSEQELQR